MSLELPLISHFIDGQAIASRAARGLPVYNPSLGKPVATVCAASSEDVAAAVAAARKAFPEWAATPPLRRARVMFRFKELLNAHTAELAALIAREHGKTVADAAGEVARGTEVVEFACGAPHLVKGEHSENVGAGIDSYSVRQPLGVVAGITPFNFPVMVPLWMAPLAIVCGNTFVLKPSERDPSSSVRLAELWREAGLPDGVFNVVQGDRECVSALLTHPDVAAVSFVGSTSVARYVHETGTKHGKRVQALGGAKNHMVIMPDADIENAADALIGAAFGSAGERCMAISVAVPVGDQTASALREALIPRVQALRIGASDQADIDMGPLVTREHLERVTSYIETGIREGAEAVIDGRGRIPKGLPPGFFLGPTIFDRVTTQMRIYQEEIFGPVLSIVRAASLEEALRIVAAHEYANGAAIFTRSGASAREFAHRAEIGMIGVNVPIPVPAAFHSFGGWRHSLFGDHHIHGMEGIRFYTRQKCVTQRWLGQGPGGFAMPVFK
jgi:malonate-semialdehyde dehydrogenase (acetylating)/methylmalonate-semialdehyde dehydrogenase